MSAPRVTLPAVLRVDPSTADLLRVEAKKVLMFNHEPFEDFMDYVPTKQLTLADIYRDATAVIDALGWDPDTDGHQDSVEVPLTLAMSSSCTVAGAICWTPTSTCSTTSAPTSTPTPSSWPRSTHNRHGVEALNRSSTPTATPSAHSRPAHRHLLGGLRDQTVVLSNSTSTACRC